MTKGRSGGNPASATAARHLEEFGFTGWHLRRTGNYDPATDTLAGPGDRFERQVAEAVGYHIGDSTVREDGAVFFLTGEPRPKPGDGLVALTRHWLIQGVDVMETGSDENIYIVICV